MRAKHQNRILKVTFFLLVLAASSYLIFSSLSENLLYFYTPSQISEKGVIEGQKIKLGGLVEEGSIIRSQNDLKVIFQITDLKEKIEVSYQGILPDLFKENQGVIAEGVLAGNQFIASNLLAKHDENYMPAEVARELGMIDYANKTNQSNKSNSFNLNDLKNQPNPKNNGY